MGGGAVTKISKSKMRLADASLGYAAIVVISTNDVVPRRFGDNIGCRPMRLAVTLDPDTYAREVDRDQLVHDGEIVSLWYGRGKQRLEMVKAAAEALLWQGGIARVRPNKPAWDCDPTTMELTVKAAAEMEGVTLVSPEQRRADLIDIIGLAERGIKKLKKAKGR